jgi:hypothetical protein
VGKPISNSRQAIFKSCGVFTPPDYPVNQILPKQILIITSSDFLFSVEQFLSSTAFTPPVSHSLLAMEFSSGRVSRRRDAPPWATEIDNGVIGRLAVKIPSLLKLHLFR